MSVNYFEATTAFQLSRRIFRKRRKKVVEPQMSSVWTVADDINYLNLEYAHAANVRPRFDKYF